MVTPLEQREVRPAPQPDHPARPQDAAVLLVSLGEVSAVTLGQGRGSSEDKRRAYN